MNGVLVTGAGGYIGGRLVRELLTRGHAVRAVARRPVSWLEAGEQRAVDLLSDPLGETCEDMSSVIHLAAPNEVQASRDPEGSMTAATTATRRIAEAARSGDVTRFVFVSTVHVYGDALSPGARVTEDLHALPHHPYSRARLACEEILADYFADDMDLVILRLTNSVGAPAHPSVRRWTLVANELCREAIERGSVTLRSPGTDWRDFVALSDVCTILARVATEAVPSGTYNLGSGSPMMVREIADLVRTEAERLLGSRPRLSAPAPEAPSEPYHVVVDKLAEAGFGVTGSVAGAIEETLRFCMDWKGHLADG